MVLPSVNAPPSLARCDPVDGTTNFVHAFPFTCVSVALTVERRVVVGVVHNPILGETYAAVSKGGRRKGEEGCRGGGGEEREGRREEVSAEGMPRWRG